jgi:hypothetical protein
MIKEVKKIPLKDSDQEEDEFWRRQSPQARVEAAFALMRQVIDIDREHTPGLLRVLTVTKRPLR